MHAAADCRVFALRPQSLESVNDGHHSQGKPETRKQRKDAAIVRHQRSPVATWHKRLDDRFRRGIRLATHNWRSRTRRSRTRHTDYSHRPDPMYRAPAAQALGHIDRPTQPIEGGHHMRTRHEVPQQQGIDQSNARTDQAYPHHHHRSLPTVRIVLLFQQGLRDKHVLHHHTEHRARDRIHRIDNRQHAAPAAKPQQTEPGRDQHERQPLSPPRRLILSHASQTGLTSSTPGMLALLRLRQKHGRSGKRRDQQTQSPEHDVEDAEDGHRSGALHGVCPVRKGSIRYSPMPQHASILRACVPRFNEAAMRRTHARARCAADEECGRDQRDELDQRDKDLVLLIVADKRVDDVSDLTTCRCDDALRTRPMHCARSGYRRKRRAIRPAAEEGS